MAGKVETELQVGTGATTMIRAALGHQDEGDPRSVPGRLLQTGAPGPPMGVVGDRARAARSQPGSGFRPPNGEFFDFFHATAEQYAAEGARRPRRRGRLTGGRRLSTAAGMGHPTTASIGAIVDQPCASPAVAARQAAGVGFQPPSPGVVVEVVEGLRSALFPGYFGLVQMTEGLRFHVGSILDEKLRHLQEQIVSGLVFAQWSQWEGAGCAGAAPA